jgi:phenylpyruvate tautomerase PptA (4-oxalocrotonate tautomerase family)
MPVAYIDLQSGLKLDAKKKLVTEVAEAIHHAYMIPDTRVYLREWSAEQISVDGQLGAPMRPICEFAVPSGLPVEGKRELVRRVSGLLPTKRIIVRLGTASIRSICAGRWASCRSTCKSFVVSMDRSGPLTWRTVCASSSLLNRSV